MFCFPCKRKPVPEFEFIDQHLAVQTDVTAHPITFEKCKSAKIVSVYDGDTVTAVIIYKGDPIKIKCRLGGIDAPEMRTKDLLEKEAAKKSRTFLCELVLHKVVRFEFIKFEKFGRVLCELYPKEGVYKDEPISTIMIAMGHAVEYHGETKKPYSPLD